MVRYLFMGVLGSWRVVMHYCMKDPALTPGTYLSNQNLPFMQYHLNGRHRVFLIDHWERDIQRWRATTKT